MTSLTLHSRGKLLTKADVQIEFQVICARCGQPVIITTILHFADCPQVSVEPCSCQIIEATLNNAKRMGLITEADIIMKDMADDVKRSNS